MPLITDLDLSEQIARLPRHMGYSTLPPRAGERYITLHYSGVNYPPTTYSGEVQRILDEASYQLHHNYGTVAAPAYPDGLLYDVVILSDGTRVRTRAKPVQLWHAGNATANRSSWAVHLMLGPKQDATPKQWSATLNVIDQLCFMDSIPRSSVVGHCEWPRHDGAPQPSPVYKLLPEQSECPGKFLHARLAAWRATTPPPIDPTIALAAAWGPIATPSGAQWGWENVTTWQAHQAQLGQCRSALLYDNEYHVITQVFERGCTRQINGRAWEVCYL